MRIKDLFRNPISVEHHGSVMLLERDLKRRAVTKLSQDHFYWVVVGYIVLRFFFFIMPIMLNAGDLLVFPDSLEYTKLSYLSVYDPSFYLQRPFVFLLLLKIVQQNYYVLAMAQWIFSIIAWLYLTFTIRKQIFNCNIRLAASLGLLFLSCGGYITCWDSMILTESLNISMIVLLIAVYLQLFSHRLNTTSIVVLIILSLLLIHLRDANILLVFFMGLFTFCLSYFKSTLPQSGLQQRIIIEDPLISPPSRGQAYAAASPRVTGEGNNEESYLEGKIYSKKRAGLLFGMIVLGVLSSSWTINKGERWLVPFTNLMATRLLDNKAIVSVFDRTNMPTSLKEYDPNYSFWQKIARYRNLSEPELNWVKKDGKSSYQKYIFLNPDYFLSAYTMPAFWTTLFGSFDLPLGYFSLSIRNYSQTQTAIYLTYFIAALSLFSDCCTVLMAMIVGVAFFKKQGCNNENINGVFVWRNCHQTLALASLLLISITISALFVWHADGIEIQRHQLMNHIQMILALFMMSILMWDSNSSASVKSCAF